MIGLSPATLGVIAKALLGHRAARATALATWEARRSDPYSAEVAASCRIELATVDAALREMRAAAPPHISAFLDYEITLIHPTAAAAQPANQEAP